MPKRLNLLPNQRVDFPEFIWGTEGFTAAELGDHVHRLFTGDYKGGFVLEGFYVEIESAITRKIVVHNGVGLDREGRIVTLESGSDYIDNQNLRKAIKLTTDPTHYISIEYELIDSDQDSVVILDPTYQNIPIADSAGDTHPAPRGKEITIPAPTRKAKSWKVVVSNTGFTCNNDPGTQVRTLQIPIAVLQVSLGVISVPSTELVPPCSSVAKLPDASGDKLIITDSRFFDASATIDIIDFENPANIKATVVYSSNDRTNHTLAAIPVVPGQFSSVQVGDVVVATSSAFTFIKPGGVYDARPMYFAFHSVGAGTYPSVAPVEENLPNSLYYEGRSLLQAPDLSGVAFSAAKYPDPASFGWGREVKWPTGGAYRTEHRLKTLKDQLSAVTVVIREMKYGEPSKLLSDGSVFSVATSGTTSNLTDTNQFFDTSFVGGTLTITTGAAAGDYNITSVVGLHTLEFTPAAPASTSGESYSVFVRKITNTSKYVDVVSQGTLNEVYRGRIDRRINTWTNDIQERFSANKVQTATVGDGITTFGDYIGSAGLAQVLKDQYSWTSGGIIYVKAGSYNIPEDLHFLRSNTHIVGDGPNATFVTINKNLFVEDDSDGIARNIAFKDITIYGASYSPTTAAGRHGILFPLNTDFVPVSIHGFVADNCVFAGGAVVLPANEVIYSTNPTESGWCFQFLNYITTTQLSKDISFRNCEFIVEYGGVVKLKGTNGVVFDNCIFNSGVSSTVAMGPVVGIQVEDDNTVANAHYFNTADMQIGVTAIKNCKFTGSMKLPVVAARRGWVFVAPNATTPVISISGCDFIGDLVGVGSSGYTLTYQKARTASGACVTNASGWSQVDISGCVFHSYFIGVQATSAITNINSSSFYKCAAAIMTGTNSETVYDFTTIEAHWIVGATVNNKIHASGISVFGTEAETAFNLLSNNSGNLHAHLEVVGSSFFRLRTVLNLNDFQTHGVFKDAYALVSFNGCNVEGCQAFSGGTAAVYGTTTPPRAAPVSGPSANFAIDVVNIVGNTFSGSSSGGFGAYLKLSGYTCVIGSNTFTEVRCSGIPSWDIIEVVGAESATINGNTFIDCYNISPVSITHVINFYVVLTDSALPTTPSIHISENTITNTPFTGVTGAIQNGVIFRHYEGSSIPLISPTLEMVGNKLVPYNANVIVAAIQNFNSVFRYCWEWRSAIITGNHFTTTIVDTTRFQTYFNDEITYEIGGVPTRFLGAVPGGASPAGYIGVVDLRRFKSNVNDSIVSVTNNTLSVENAFSNSGNLGTVANVGIRVSKWPKHAIISDNVLTECCISYAWTFGTPFDASEGVSFFSSGYSIKITNNIINAENCNSNIEVIPATGFITTDSADSLYSFVCLTIQGNTVSTDPNAQNGVYLTGRWGDVKLSALDATFTGNAAHTNTFSTANQKFIWILSGNVLLHSAFTIDTSSTGVGIATVSDGLPVNYPCAIQIFGNTHLAAQPTGVSSIFGVAIAGATGEGYAADASAAGVEVPMITANNASLRGTDGQFGQSFGSA